MDCADEYLGINKEIWAKLMVTTSQRPQLTLEQKINEKKMVLKYDLTYDQLLEMSQRLYEASQRPNNLVEQQMETDESTSLQKLKQQNDEWQYQYKKIKKQLYKQELEHKKQTEAQFVLEKKRVAKIQDLQQKIELLETHNTEKGMQIEMIQKDLNHLNGILDETNAQLDELQLENEELYRQLRKPSPPNIEVFQTDFSEEQSPFLPINPFTLKASVEIQKIDHLKSDLQPLPLSNRLRASAKNPRNSVASSMHNMSVISGVKYLRNDMQEINDDFLALGLQLDQSKDEIDQSYPPRKSMSSPKPKEKSMTRVTEKKVSKNNQKWPTQKDLNLNFKRLTVKNITNIPQISPGNMQQDYEKNRPPTSKFGSTLGENMFKFEDDSFKCEIMEEEEPPHPNQNLMLSDNYMDENLQKKSSRGTNLDQTMLTDRSIVEEEIETFQVRYNVSKDQKQNVLRIKYAKKQRIKKCEEKLEQYILNQIKFKPIIFSRSLDSEGFKLTLSDKNIEYDLFKIMALSFIAKQPFYYVEKMVAKDLKLMYESAKKQKLEFYQFYDWISSDLIK